MAKIPLDRNGKITLLKWLQSGCIDTDELPALRVEPLQIEIIDRRFSVDDLPPMEKYPPMCQEIQSLGFCPYHGPNQ